MASGKAYNCLSRSAPVLVAGALISLIGVKPVQADSLAVGGSYPSLTAIFAPLSPNAQTFGSGSINPSYLNGVALPYLYCVQIDVDINVGATYNTSVTTDGNIFGTPIVNNDKVAYLIDHYAAGATTADQQTALQAAIWKEIYGDNFTLQDSVARQALYTTYLTDVGSDPVSNLLWLSPSGDDGSHLQGLVTSPIPEPAFYQMSALVALGGIGLLRKRRK